MLKAAGVLIALGLVACCFGFEEDGSVNALPLLFFWLAILAGGYLFFLGLFVQTPSSPPHGR